MTGIYCIKNLITGRMYIGQSIELSKRLQNHFTKLKKQIHPNTDMQDEYNKYKESSFVRGVIEYSSVLDLNRKEDIYISKYNTIELGYNKSLSNSKTFTSNSDCKIMVYDRNTAIYLGKFESIEALSFITNIHPSKIIPVLEYRVPSYKDYIFIKEDDNLESYINKWSVKNNIKIELNKNDKYYNWKINALKAAEKNRKPVLQIDMDNNIINEYISAREAAEKNVGYKYKGIYKAVSGDRNHYKGFKWEYK